MSEDLRKTLERERKGLFSATIALLIATMLIFAFYLLPFFSLVSEEMEGSFYRFVPLTILLISWLLVAAFFLWIRHWEKRLNALTPPASSFSQTGSPESPARAPGGGPRG